MNEMLNKLAEASGWTIPDDRMSQLTSLYNGTMQDTHLVRELDLGSSVPATLYKAGD
jgi:hypothetical protein